MLNEARFVRKLSSAERDVFQSGVCGNEAFHLDELPKRVLIAGGGYIANEFAGIFNGFGRKVTQLYRSEQILRGFDRDVRDHLAGEIRKKGIDLRTDTNVTAIEKTKNGYRLSLTSGRPTQTSGRPTQPELW